MYSKAEASALRESFWTTFGIYMAPLPSAEGEKTAWVNYKTGNRWVSFRMDAGVSGAALWIELTSPDAAVRAEHYRLLESFKNGYPLLADDGWSWQPVVTMPNGQIKSVIERTLPGVSVLTKAHWPQLIPFFKNGIMELDAFWAEVKYAFDV